MIIKTMDRFYQIHDLRPGDLHEMWQVDSHGAALRQMAEAGKIQQVLKTIATRIISPLTLW